MGAHRFSSQPSQPPRDGHVQGGYETDAEGSLTCIRERIHCVATPDTTEVTDDLADIQIDNFLKTLAEVALSVARRRMQPDSKGGEVGA